MFTALAIQSPAYAQILPPGLTPDAKPREKRTTNSRDDNSRAGLEGGAQMRHLSSASIGGHAPGRRIRARPPYDSLERNTLRKARSQAVVMAWPMTSSSSIDICHCI